MAYKAKMRWAVTEDDSDESGVETLEDEYGSYKNASIVIIDNCYEMFAADEDDNCPFKTCLRACLQTLDKYVIPEYYNTLAVTILHKEHHEPIIEFNTNVLKSIKTLLDLCRKTSDELKQMFGSDKIDSPVMFETLTSCLTLFRNSDRLMHKTKRHIVILTNKAEPFDITEENEDLDRVMERISYLKIELIVLPLVNDFAWNVFYKDLVNKSMKSETDTIHDFTSSGFENVEMLSSTLDKLICARKNFKRMVFWFSPHRMERLSEDDPEFRKHCFYVQVQKVFKERKIYHNAKIDPRTGRECILKAKRRTDEETKSDEAAKSRERTGANPVEKRALRKSLQQYQQPSGLKLLFVSDQRSDVHCVKGEAFLVQQDEIYNENEEVEHENLFPHFWKYCESKNKVLICSYITRSIQKHHTVELKPYNYNGRPCFMGQWLTYADEVNPFSPEKYMKENPSARGIDIATACKVIKKLTIRDSRKLFSIHDYHYEKREAKIKAHLFSTEDAPWEPPEVPLNWPDKDDIAARIGPELEQEFKHKYTSQIFKRKKGKK